MRTRQLGDTDLELTTVGLGTWAIGGANWRFGWGAQDDDEAVALVTVQEVVDVAQKAREGRDGISNFFSVAEVVQDPS